MKYRDLLKALQTLPEENLDQDVTVFNYGDDETFAVDGVTFTGPCDDDTSPTGVLDDGHFYLFFNAAER